MSNHTNPVAPIADLPPIKNNNVQTKSVPEISGNSSAIPDKKNIRILIVEDEPDARMIFKSLLEVNTPYTIIDAKDGIEALKLLENKDIDLVLLDIIMTPIDGIEVLKTLKENPDKYGTPKVVMLTNLSSDDSKASAEQYKVDGYLMKVNVEPDELVRQLDSFLK